MATVPVATVPVLATRTVALVVMGIVVIVIVVVSPRACAALGGPVVAVGGGARHGASEDSVCETPCSGFEAPRGPSTVGNPWGMLGHV